eukprot:scaffold44803_cov72-Phaeocystis_antarctica.AAC.2
MAPTCPAPPSSAATDEKSVHASSGSAATRASVAAVCLASSASDSTPAACHTPHSGAAPAVHASDASSQRTAAGSAASHRAMRTAAPLAPSSAHSAAPPRASAPLRDASTSADAPRDSASQRAVSSPSPPVPPVNNWPLPAFGTLPSASITAFASRGTLKPPRDHSSSGSPGGAPPVASIHCQATGANPSFDAQPSGSVGSSTRAARAKPKDPAVATPTAVHALLTANDTDSSHTIGGAACDPAIEDTSCRARASAGSGKSDSVAETTMTGRSFASSACGALSRRNTAGSLELPSSRMAPAPEELPPGALCHAVLYRCRRAVVAAELSTRVRKPTICALPTPSPPPSATSAASAPDASATAQSTPAAGPRISKSSTANGRRSSGPSIGPPLLSRAVNCSAPSRSAGCTCVPASRARRRSRAVASPPPPSHAASITWNAGPSCNPHRSRAAASPNGRHAAASAAAHCPLQCTAGAASPPPLRTSNAPPSSSAHSIHATPPASSASGCRKNTARSAAPAAEGEAAAEHAARAVSR